MTEKFRPDGSEDRALFFSAWCFQFQRDRAMREGADIDECDDDEVCPIVARIFLPINDPEYPGEIRLDDAENPICAAYVPAGHPIPEPRCEHTEDLFGATA